MDVKRYLDVGFVEAKVKWSIVLKCDGGVPSSD